MWIPSLYLDDTTSANPVSTPPATVTYTVEVSAGTLCPPSYANSTVTVLPPPYVQTSSDTTILAGSAAQITSTSNGYSFLWTPSLGLSCTNCANPLASPMKTTRYVITTIDTNGCVNSDTVLIKVDDLLTLYVPSAFTPYQYKNNSVFYAYGVGIYQFEFFIFDRWGSLIFKTNDPAEGWDGTYKGQMVQQDVYVFLAKAVSITGKTISRTGPVTVVR
jgi:gliding motility-associated-like protein